MSGTSDAGSAGPVAAQGGRGRSSPRGRLLCALGALAGSGIVVLAAGRTWVTAAPSDAPGVATVPVAGSQAAPAASALALAAAAAAVALLVTGRIGRRLAAGVLLLARGRGGRDGRPGRRRPGRCRRRAAVATATGRTGAPCHPVTVSGWVWLALAAGLLSPAAAPTASPRAARWPRAGPPFRDAVRRGRPRAGRRTGATAPRRRRPTRSAPGTRSAGASDPTGSDGPGLAECR